MIDRFRAALPLLVAMVLAVCGGSAFVVGGASEHYLHWWPGLSNQPRDLGPTFGEAWNLVEQNYVDRQAVQPQKMTDGAITGMLDSLGDIGHTGYLTASDYEKMTANLKGTFSGIGGKMIMRARQPTVFSTVPGSPASKQLKQGDVFLEVNGKSVQGQSLKEVTSEVAGPKGTQVHLVISRQGKKMDLTIERATFPVPDVTARILPSLHPGDPKLAHIAIESFGDNADTQLRQSIDDMRSQGAQGFVIDLRTNPGGERDQAVAVTSEFLPAGTVIFQAKDAQGAVRKIRVTKPGNATTIPLVVLIDEGTASSAEILAAAIKDNQLNDIQRGKLVGTPTFGTGTVLGQFQLSDGSAVLIAVEEWLTPNGQSIWHKGIQPDITVSLPKDALALLPETEQDLTADALAHSSDKQLLEAIHQLTTQMAKH
jgi:carboxyl-terminal processing protease